MSLLSINNLWAGIGGGANIIKGLSLNINKGEVHAIMGPNGSGKSTLSHVLGGRENYIVSDGEVSFCGENLLEMSVEERAQKGLFIAFQYPVELPGVNSSYFLRTALNSVRKSKGEKELSVKEFSEVLQAKSKLLELDTSLLSRSVNEGFSGGEKKKAEILQMAVLEPKLAILDETDSGLDIDALQIVAKGVNALKREDNAVLVITHYQRLLNYIVPDYVHVLIDGKIVCSGDKSLAFELEDKGYNWLEKESCGG